MQRKRAQQARSMMVSVGLALVVLAGCGTAAADVKAVNATPDTAGRTGTTQPRTTRPGTTRPRTTRPGTTRPPTSGTDDQSPDTQETPPTIVESQPPPSLDSQSAAQALIDEVPKLVGDSGSQRKSNEVDDALRTALQAIADGNAAGDSTFFDAVGAGAADGDVIDPYLMCPIADGDACAASKEDFEAYMQTCSGPSTQWTAMLVPGADANWAAAAVCLWRPTDAEKTAATDAVAKTIVAATQAAKQPLTRDATLDSAAQAWAAAFTSVNDPGSLPAFADLNPFVTSTVHAQSPGEITNGQLVAGYDDSFPGRLAGSVTHFGVAAVVVDSALLVLIVAA